MAIVVIGIYLGFKREFSKLIGFLVVALVAVGLVFNAGGVKDVLLELFNKIIGAQLYFHITAVSYTHLLEVGTKYQLVGWQMLQEENAELIINGKRVENDYTFIACLLYTSRCV